MEKDKVDVELIRQYLRGELSPRAMYALERRAQDDPALMDIILGMEGETQDVHAANLADIHRRIDQRTQRGRTRRLLPFQRWAVAASVLLALTISTLWFMRQDVQEQNQPAVASAPSDALEQRSERPAAPTSGDAEEAPAAKQAAPSAAPAKEEPAQVQRLARTTTEGEAAASAPRNKTSKPVESAERIRDTQEAAVVIRYGTQKASTITGAIHLPEATAADTNKGQRAAAVSERMSEIRIRGVSPTGQPAQQAIMGKVVDQETQAPLQGAVLQLADNRTVVTDSTGRFVIRDPSQTLTASYLGYEQQQVSVAAHDSITIALRPAAADLSEVVVVGYGGETTGKPEPLGGWRAYNRYLKRGINQTEGATGTITLTFTIDDGGTPTHIQVVRTTDTALSNRAIQLVREGPKWKPGKNDERVAELQIKL
ncbi:carboxypeptidase-like regulatory domain-containing protein [Parapedobacter sp. DT-150]|uniref:carboxypeptidase-like regulatory domain-containing protein n=1 Tax=Parapedobacter sp. DT-150 TaxID=3396162 RepID=UPI003F1CAB72